MVCGPLAVADRGGDGPFGGDHVAAREHAGMRGHHVRTDRHDPVDQLHAGQRVDHAAVDVLP
jgi:hypothetical protein